MLTNGITDQIVEEVRANREAHAQKFNYNLQAIYEDLKKSEKKRIQQGHLSIEPAAKTANTNMSTKTAKPHRFAL